MNITQAVMLPEHKNRAATGKSGRSVHFMLQTVAVTSIPAVSWLRHRH